MPNPKPSFEEAINASLIWCNAWEAGEISDEVIADHVAQLIASKSGARGFFAVSLSSDIPLLDRIPESIAIQLRKAGEEIVDLLVRNMAMSSAMGLHHKKEGKKIQQAGSERITARCQELLRLLDPVLVKKNLEMLLFSLEGEGKYSAFLRRWNYDKDQKKEIYESINQIAD